MILLLKDEAAQAQREAQLPKGHKGCFQPEHGDPTAPGCFAHLPNSHLLVGLLVLRGDGGDPYTVALTQSLCVVPRDLAEYGAGVVVPTVDCLPRMPEAQGSISNST